MNVLGISGSLRRGSFNTALLNAATELAPAGMTITPAPIGDLPLYDDDVRAAGYPPQVERFREAIRAADALLFVSPEYNRSISGVLKNAIDWASRPPSQPLDGKRALVMTAAPGGLGGALANHHLRQVLVYLNVHIMPGPEVMVAGAGTKFDAEGRLADEATRKFVAGQLARFMEYAKP